MFPVADPEPAARRVGDPAARRASVPAPRSATGRRPSSRLADRALPAWPVAALFLGYPLWWSLGLTVALLPVVGAMCLFLMALRGWIHLPRMWMCWVSFLIWMAASAVMIDTPGRLIGFLQRFTGVLGATLVVLYVYNARENLPRRRMLAMMSVFMVWLAVGGYLGMAFPYRRISTLALALTPPTVADNEYVVELLSPRFAEVQTPYGAPAPFVRPSAPFPYTNEWGHTFVLLLPVIAALAVHASRRTRIALVALVAVAVPPALATLNRGILVGIAVMLAYWSLRFFRRLALVRVLQLGLAAAVLGAGVSASGVLARIGERTSTSSTTADRYSLYVEAFQRTLQSPLLGWGAPRPSLTVPVSVGTQGHFWYLMFSHGFVGLALFVGTLVGLVWVTRAARSTEEIFIHTPLVVMSVTLLFYGVDPLHLVICMCCAVMLMRAEVRTSNRRVGRRGRPAPARTA